MQRLSADSTWLGSRIVNRFVEGFVFTVSAVYFVTTVGMSPLELVLVGTFMELTVFLFEVPTGIVADTYSRRASIVIGTVIMGLAFVFVGAVPEVWAVLLGWSLWGFGYTFTSGASEAWLADEVGTDRFSSILFRGAQLGRASTIVGIVTGVALALVSLQLPIVAGGVLLVALGAFFALLMPETGFTPHREPQAGPVSSMIRTGRAGAGLVRGTPILLLILAIGVFWGAWSEGYDRLWEAHLIREVGLPDFLGLDFIVWFGVLGVASLLLAIVIARPLNRRLERAGQRRLTRVLLALNVVLIASVAGFGLAGNFALAAAAVLLTDTVRSLAMPLFSVWLNRNITESSVRATVLSITNQADAVGQWTGGPAVGLVGNAFGIRTALVAGSFLLAPALALYGRALRHGGKEPELEEVARPAET